MRFLLDVPFARSTAAFFRARGHDADLVREVLGERAPDPAIVQHAADSAAVVVTFDLDFGALIASGRVPPVSVITLRLSKARPDAVEARLAAVLANLEPELARGALVTIEDDRVRVRHIPLPPSSTVAP